MQMNLDIVDWVDVGSSLVKSHKNGDLLAMRILIILIDRCPIHFILIDLTIGFGGNKLDDDGIFIFEISLANKLWMICIDERFNYLMFGYDVDGQFTHQDRFLPIWMTFTDLELSRYPFSDG